MLVHLLPGGHVRSPPLTLSAGLKLVAHVPEALVALASPSVEFCHCDQAVGQGFVMLLSNDYVPIFEERKCYHG